MGKISRLEKCSTNELLSEIKKNNNHISKINKILENYDVWLEKFENDFAKYIGTRGAVACSSGTSALELIFASLNVNKKEVVVPSNTFLVTVIAIINAGGIPVFADCNDAMCLDFESAIS